MRNQSPKSFQLLHRLVRVTLTVDDYVCAQCVKITAVKDPLLPLSDENARNNIRHCYMLHRGLHEYTAVGVKTLGEIFTVHCEPKNTFYAAFRLPD